MITYVVTQDGFFDREFDTESEAEQYESKCRRLYVGSFAVVPVKNVATKLKSFEKAVGF
jgi:hypothetical protein